jgi:CxxC-x17-CxxC domain-containing protein
MISALFYSKSVWKPLCQRLDIYLLIIGNLLFSITALQQIEVIVTYQRPKFEGKCTDCGNATTLPFKPTPGKPVYCRTCFSKHMTNRPESAGSNRESFAPKQAWARRRDNGQAMKDEEAISIFQRR